MTKPLNLIRSIVVTLLILLNSSCVNTSDSMLTEPLISTKHMFIDSQSAWLAAANKHDLFSLYNVSILANITWEKRTDASSYQFVHLTIGSEVDADSPYTLDLINPSFTSKMACGWYCEYLDQPILQTALGPYTMLDKVYEGQKSELLNFYEGISQLNLQLNSLDTESQPQLKIIFDQVRQSEQSFNSLADALGFLNDYFDDMLNNKKLLYVNGQIPGPDKGVESPDLNPEEELIGTFRSDLTLSEMLNLPPEPEKQTKLSAVQTNGSHKSNLSKRPLQSTQEDEVASSTENPNILLSQADLTVGQFVCSVQGNYFGKISDIQDDNVILDLRGRAMEVQNGALMEAEDGILFATGVEFSYLSVNDKKAFKPDELGTCSLSGF